MLQIPDWLPPRPTFDNFVGLSVALTLYSGAVEVPLYVTFGIPPVLGGPLMALAGLLGLVTVFKQAARFPVSSPVLVPLGFWSAFVVWALLSAIWSTSPGVVTGKLLLLSGVSLAFLVFGICVGFLAAAFDAFERMLFAVGLATAAAIFIFTRRGMPHLSGSAAAQALTAFMAAYQPMTLCVSLAAMVALVHTLAQARSRMWTVAWGAAWIFLTAGTLAGGGRGAAIGGALGQLAVLLFAMITFRRRQGSARLLGVLLAVPFLAAALLAAGTMLEFRGIERLLNLVDASTDKSGRMELWMAALRMADSHPLFGAGLASFHGSANNLEALGLYPHNVFLELLAETGLVGFTLFIIAFAAAIVAAARRAWSLPFVQAAIWLGLLVCTIFEMNVSGSLTGRDISFVLGLSVGLTARYALYGPAQPASPSRTPQSPA